MSLTPEAKVKNTVKKLLDMFGAYYFMPPANGYGRAGIPDIIACYHGQFIAVECKAGRNKPTALQVRELAMIDAVGGRTFVINEQPETLKELEATLERIRSYRYG